ncbi:MAG TPA: protein kinase [Ktedonobacteraceae bacterium]|nr:protein kinase [Ktedonobacteraceae bacterium]
MTLEYIPCARNDNVGEQVTRNYLMSHLAHTEGKLLGNYQLPMNNSTLECDFVLFNRRGVWIIEVKNWRGIIKIDQVNWERDDGLIQHSPLQSVELKAKKLYSVLRDEGHTNISVVGLVVLAQSHATLNNTNGVINREPHESKVFHLDAHLIQALNGRQFLHDEDNRELHMKEIQKIVDMLLPRAVDLNHKRIGGNYQIEYDLGYGPDKLFRAYQAVHLTIPGRYARAKKYHNPTAFTTKALKGAVRRFQRDMQVLGMMERHPNIVQMYDYQADRDGNDTYWLLLEWIDGFTLQDSLDNGDVMPFQEQLRILKAILNALEFCHGKNIIHRNLTPACIYLAKDGTVKLGDFDFARVPDLLSTITITGELLLTKTNRYMAPELRTDAHAADARSDLYSLGAIWYDMLVCPQPGEDINLSCLQETALSPDARDLLARLLASDPHQRPQNVKAVKRWLEQV